MFLLRARVTAQPTHTHLTEHIWYLCTSVKPATVSGRRLHPSQKAYPWNFVKHLHSSNTNQKTLQNSERYPTPVNWKRTSYWKILLSWDLGTEFCFLESCQAYTACKPNIQNHARSTAAKMLKSTWSLILSHPAQKSTTLTSSTSIQNGQLSLWKKTDIMKNHSIS